MLQVRLTLRHGSAGLQIAPAAKTAIGRAASTRVALSFHKPRQGKANRRIAEEKADFPAVKRL
jgi:hypothetical protein